MMPARSLLLLAWSLFYSGTEGVGATVNYADQTASVFHFSQINEVSPLGTFLGNASGPAGSPTPLALTDSLGVDSLGFSPSANLAVAASGNPASSYALSKFSFHISSPSNAYITDLKITLRGTYKINNNPLPTDRATIFLDTEVFLEAFSNLGALPSGPAQTARYQFPKQTWTEATASSTEWSLQWDANLASIFSAPTMNVTKINLSITPDIFLLAENFGSGNLFLNQMTVAVIPEPNTGTLLLLGFAPLLRKRRGSTSS